MLVCLHLKEVGGIKKQGPGCKSINGLSSKCNYIININYLKLACQYLFQLVVLSFQLIVDQLLNYSPGIMYTDATSALYGT